MHRRKVTEEPQFLLGASVRTDEAFEQDHAHGCGKPHSSGYCSGVAPYGRPEFMQRAKELSAQRVATHGVIEIDIMRAIVGLTVHAAGLRIEFREHLGVDSHITGLIHAVAGGIVCGHVGKVDRREVV